jgi:L-lactate dehydrogenase complex protein LldE
MTLGDTSRPRVGLFVTCLVDIMRPSVGFAAVRLLEAAGCNVEVPTAQTCCGQPGYNSGDMGSARALALSTIRAFAGYDYVVAPSGSCAAMLKLHYPRLLSDDDVSLREARAFAGRVYELTAFLVNVRGVKHVPGAFTGRVVYHDACSAKREMDIGSEPHTLLKSMHGVDLVEPRERESCCGFGGLFATKYPELSTALADAKIESLGASSPEIIVGPDLGCLLHIAGRLARRGSRPMCRHVAEVLAGEMNDPPIAGPM